MSGGRGADTGGVGGGEVGGSGSGSGGTGAAGSGAAGSRAAGSGAAGSPTVLFEERTPAPTWLRIGGVLALVVAVLLVVDATVIDPGSFQGGGFVAAVVAVVVLLALGVLALIARIDVVVDAQSVVFALAPVWRVRFERGDVDSAKTVTIARGDFGGPGYRVLPGNKRGLLFTSGRGVAVVRRSTGLHYTVRSERPTELVSALLRRR